MWSGPTSGGRVSYSACCSAVVPGVHSVVAFDFISGMNPMISSRNSTVVAFDLLIIEFFKGLLLCYLTSADTVSSFVSFLKILWATG